MLGAKPSVARRVLAYRAGALGDMLLLFPALSALRRWAGESGRLELAGTEPYVRLALGDGRVDAVHDAGRGVFRSLFDERAGDRELRVLLEGFDVVVAWASASALPGKAASLGLEALVAPAWPPPGIHAADHYLGSLARLGVGVPEAAEPPRLSPSQDAIAAAGHWLRERRLDRAKLVLVHPSSGSPAKNWPVASFARFRELVERDGFELVWIEGPADGEVLAALGGREDRVARHLALPVLAALLARARIYVGNDSGVTHLAAVSGARVLALFGPSDPRQWAPRGPFVTVTHIGTSPEELWEFGRKQI